MPDLGQGKDNIFTKDVELQECMLSILKTADLPASFERDSSSTATALRVLELLRSTTGTAASGIGAELAFKAENSGGALETAAVIAGILNTVTPSGEHATLKIQLASDSSLFTAMDLVASTSDSVEMSVYGSIFITGSGVINNLNVNNYLTLSGPIKIKRTAVGAADYNPSILTNDYLIAVNNTAAARAVTISTEDIQSGSTTQPRIFIIKDESGGAATNPITVSGESGTIDGEASIAITQNYASLTVYADGTNLFIY